MTTSNPHCLAGGPQWCCIDVDAAGLWCQSCLTYQIGSLEFDVDVLRTIAGRLLDGWVVGDNCDPDTPEGEEWAWERCRIAPPGSFVDEREPFEDGVDEVLRSFDPPADDMARSRAETEAGQTGSNSRDTGSSRDV